MPLKMAFELVDKAKARDQEQAVKAGGDPELPEVRD
jgi:hypothetical protein